MLYFAIVTNVTKKINLLTVANSVVISNGLPLYTSGVQKCTGNNDNLKKIQNVKIKKTYNKIGLYIKSNKVDGL